MNQHELERFMALIDKSDSGCWEWKAAKRHGYGQFALKTDGKWITRAAHRISVEHFHKAEIGKLFVCHKCDNPSCVNPEHLFLGTQLDNLLDAKAKNRIYKGGPGIPWTRKKTHCLNGHPLSGENLSKYSGRRVCKACMRQKNADRKLAKEQS